MCLRREKFSGEKIFISGIIKNCIVHYRKKMLSSLVSQIDQASSVYDLSKKLTVLYAIVWTRAAIADTESWSTDVLDFISYPDYQKEGSEEKMEQDFKLANDFSNWSGYKTETSKKYYRLLNIVTSLRFSILIFKCAFTLLWKV